VERQRLTVKGLKDMLAIELEHVTKRILDAQDHAEKRLQIEVGTLRADINRRFDVVGTHFDEINEHFKGVNERFAGMDRQFDEVKGEIVGLKGDISEIKGLIKDNH
jgi:archaellum component FlaC